MTKASHKKTTVDIIKYQKRQQKKAYGLARQNLTGYTDAAGGFTTMHQVSTASSGGSNTSSFLKTGGGTMIGPLAFWMGNELIYPTPNNNNTLNLTPTEGAYTSHWVWATFGGSPTGDLNSGVLEIITNNDPDTAFSGQILFIENTETTTPVIKDRSNTSGGTTGNIKTLDGEDFTFPSNKTIVLFMFSSIDNLWHQVSNPAAGGASTTLNNLGTTSINADLLPDSDAGQDLGANGTAWGTLFTDSIRLYSGTASASPTKTHGGYIRLYVGNSHKYIAYYN